jgi:hypothetical protein
MIDQAIKNSMDALDNYQKLISNNNNTIMEEEKSKMERTRAGNEPFETQNKEQFKKIIEEEVERSNVHIGNLRNK